jgi:hypothetical protein
MNKLSYVVFVCKHTLKVIECVIYNVEFGCTPMTNYFIFLSVSLIDVGSDMSEYVTIAQKAYPDIFHKDEHNNTWIEFGKYSFDGICEYPWEEIVK